MWHIIKRKLWTQRSELKIMLVMAGISLMMIFAFSDFSGTYKPTVLVVDEAGSTLSAQFVDQLQSDPGHNYALSAQDKALEQVKSGKAMAMLTIESGFDEAFKQASAAKISLLSVKQDADTLVLKPAVLNAYRQMQQFDQTAGQIALAAKAKGHDYDSVYRETYDKLAKDLKEKPALSLKLGDDGSGEVRNAVLMHSLIGFLIFFVAYSCVFGAADLLVERRQNTWQRLVISPSSKLGMLLGHFVVSWVIGLLQLLLVFTFGAKVFGIDFGGSLVQMFGAAAVFCLAMSGIGILISAFGKSMQQISALTSVALTAFGMLGGCLWPLDLVSNPILIGLSRVVPHRYAVEALTRLSEGKSLESIYGQLLVLVGIAAITLGLGFVKILKTEEQFR